MLALGKMSRRAQNEALIGGLLLVPGLLGLAVLTGVPLVQGVALAFTNRYLLEPESGQFSGIQNFVTFVRQPLFGHYIKNTLIWIVGGLIGKIGLGMILALLLNREIRFRGVYRSLALIPWVMPMIAAGLVWRWIFEGAYGVLNYLLYQVGLIDKYITFLADKSAIWPAILVVAWWKGYPFSYAIILAGLQMIQKDLYEAAAVDGATGLRAFTNITLPQLRPVLFVLVLLETVWTANDFTSIWVLTQGGPPPDYTMTLTPLVYVTTMQFSRIGYGSAIGVILMIFMMIFTIVYVRQVRSDAS